MSSRDVFTRTGSTWTQQAKLTAADGAAFDGFGTSVAVNGDTALVGPLFDDVGANSIQGSTYVFTLIVRSDFKNAAEFCNAQRALLGDDEFTKRYGSNRNGANAFGQCVRSNR